MKKLIDVLLSAVHLVIGMGLLIASQLIANRIALLLFRGNVVAVYIVYAILYIVITLLLTMLYAKLTERISPSGLGVVPKLPSPIWLAIGIALPLGVTLFYILLADGKFIQTSSEIAFILVSVTLPSAAAGPTEEVIFRGMMMRSLQKRWGTVVGVVAPSFMFAAVHVIMMSNVTAVSYLMLLVSGTLVGVMFSLIVLYSGSIWASTVVHSLWNVIIIGGILSIHAPGTGVTEMALYEYELASSNLFLTGGIYGIECSLPAMVGFAVISLVILVKMKDKKAERTMHV